MSKNKAVYKLEPAGLLDRISARVMTFEHYEVQIVQPAGCPRNGTMGQVYVQVAQTGEFIGMVNKSSLVRTGRTAPVRDRAAEARDARSAQLRSRIRVR